MKDGTFAVIGAGGVQARRLLSILGERGDLSKVTAVDRAWEPAAADALIAAGAEVVTLDLLAEPARLVELLTAQQLCVNLAGPFHRLAGPCLDAAIAAGCDYLDICDDGDVAMELIARDTAARDAGIVALTGMGSSPGMTNVLIRAALNHLGGGEGVDVRLLWCAPAVGASFAGYSHLLHCYRTAIGGRDRTPEWDELEPEWIDFPEPAGRVRVVRMGHSEPATIPHFTGASCVNKGGITPAENTMLVYAHTRAVDGLEGEVRRAEELRLKSEFDALNALLARTEPAGGVGMQIDITRDGQGFRISAGSDREMDYATAVPAAAGTLLMLDDHGLKPGVWAPECLEPKRLFDKLGQVSGGGGSLTLQRMQGGAPTERMRLRDFILAT
jgi:saccharopine dehydrogenase (NAD+, L-lysine-forming)